MTQFEFETYSEAATFLASQPQKPKLFIFTRTIRNRYSEKHPNKKPYVVCTAKHFFQNGIGYITPPNN